jgi:hypothetical protein
MNKENFKSLLMLSLRHLLGHMMMKLSIPNVIVAISNLYAFRPIIKLFENNSFDGALGVSFAMISGILFNLAEHHNSGLMGLPDLCSFDDTFYRIDISLIAIISSYFMIKNIWNGFSFSLNLMPYLIVFIILNWMKKKIKATHEKIVYRCEICMLANIVIRLCEFHFIYLFILSHI